MARNRHSLGGDGERGAQDGPGKACSQDATEEDLREHISLQENLQTIGDVGITSVAITFHTQRKERRRWGGEPRSSAAGLPI